VEAGRAAAACHAVPPPRKGAAAICGRRSGVAADGQGAAAGAPKVKVGLIGPLVGVIILAIGFAT
jgi:hypothetical protein